MTLEEYLDELDKILNKIESSDIIHQANEWSAIEDIKIAVDKAKDAFKYNR